MFNGLLLTSAWGVQQNAGGVYGASGISSLLKKNQVSVTEPRYFELQAIVPSSSVKAAHTCASSPA